MNEAYASVIFRIAFITFFCVVAVVTCDSVHRDSKLLANFLNIRASTFQTALSLCCLRKFYPELCKCSRLATLHLICRNFDFR